LDTRQEALKHWAVRVLDWPEATLTPASSDASFRRYFRLQHRGASYIVMDAPPEQEDCEPFVQVSGLLLGLGLHVPEVLARNRELGFLLLSDLGSRQYLDALDESSVDRLYGDALAALLTLQTCGPVDSELPLYGRDLLMTEMSLFMDWLLGTHLELPLDSGQRTRLHTVFGYLAENALQQPQVCVHRDFHSRNLMVSATHNPGVLDFQDAAIGPVTYDLVSLLRDCYISWPRGRVETWALGYYALAQQSGILRPADVSEQRFLQWFDLMGVQRHLKAAGIFARLYHRDGKSGYLGDIPRTLGYVREVSARYAELEPLAVAVNQALGRL